MRTLGKHELLERDAELAAIRALIDAARGSAGRAIVIEGRAGLGKTRLLSETRALASEAGMTVLSARGGELEREFSYGVVRQLFEPELAAAGEERAKLLSGAARLASPRFEGAELTQPGASEESAFSWLHGLYWLTANLAALRPLAFVVDDLHWCDAPSLRFVGYLLRRLEGLPLLVAAALRPAEGGTEAPLLAEVVGDPDAVLVRPAALTRGAATTLVREELSSDADDVFCAACHEATGGNPLLLGELVAALAAEGVEPTAAEVQRVREVGPEAVSRSVRLRLARLPAEAVALARAAAVLGDDVELRHAAALAGLDREQAAHAATTLARADLLRLQTPLAFAHPVVREAVYADLSPGDREAAHARSARLLAEAGAADGQVAAHLLHTPAAGDPWVVTTLRGAARRSRSEGSADIAATYLGRALDEPPVGDSLRDVLYELGSAERLVHGRSAVEHLSRALELTTDPTRRARTALELGRTLLFASRPEEAVEVFDKAISEVPPGEHQLVQALQAGFLAGSMWEPTLTRHTADRVGRIRDSELDMSGGGRLLLAALAFYDARTGEKPRAEAVERARAALAGGALLAEEDASGYIFAGLTLTLAAEFEEAMRLPAAVS